MASLPVLPCRVAAPTVLTVGWSGPLCFRSESGVAETWLGGASLKLGVNEWKDKERQSILNGSKLTPLNGHKTIISLLEVHGMGIRVIATRTRTTSVLPSLARML